MQENDINLLADYSNNKIVTDYLENEILVNSNDESYIVNCDKKTKNRSVNSEKMKWKRETTKKNRMNGEAYIGYKRNGKVVEHNSK